MAGSGNPQVILRIGSHAEKEYFEKLAKSLDGVMIGSNLLEITPAATCSFLLSLRTKRGGAPVPFYLDPMTYCFGAYIDPQSALPRSDLHALKSTRYESRQSKRRVTRVKDSYMTVADRLGPVFRTAVNDGDTCRAIDPAKISMAERDSFCQGVINYQLTRVSEIVADEELIKMALGQDGKPSAVFVPYFYIHTNWLDAGIDSLVDFATRSVEQTAAPVHAVVCATSSLLLSGDRLATLSSRLRKTGIAGAWLWFDGLSEYEASVDELRALRGLVAELAKSMKVFNLHGGFFSLLLASDGLSGISHGVGYGEQKPVAQVIGPAAPTVRYYLPSISRRVAVPDIQRCFRQVGVSTTEDFFAKVCGCQICKGALASELSMFKRFGEMHKANEEATRESQTPAAAKLCRYHFLINRMRERQLAGSLQSTERGQHVRERSSPWRHCFSLKSYLGDPSEAGYLERWAEALL